MRKLFTLLVAAMFSLAMYGQLTLEEGIPGTLTDLTPEGTYLTSLALDVNNLDGSRLILLPNGKVVFSATDGGTAYGDEMYVTDGTVEGTMLLKDINEGTPSSSPTSFCLSGDHCFFAANDSAHGAELWVTDGTVEGTMMVMDINVTPYVGSNIAKISPFLDGKVLFKAQDAFDAADEKGGSLWVSDGTEAGTGMVHPVEPIQGLGPWSFNPMILTLEDRAIFAGDDGKYGTELWVTDGAIESTHTNLILDIMFAWKDSADHSQGTIGNPDIDWGAIMNTRQIITRPRPSGFFYPEHQGKNYTSVHNEPWVTDGTPEGTYPLIDMNKDETNDGSQTKNSGYGETAIFKGMFFFRGNLNPYGNQWHVTDGTPEGTKCFCDIRGWGADGNHQGAASALDYSAIWGEYFITGGDASGYDTVVNHFKQVWGRELLITDGDSANTELFADIAPGEKTGVPRQKADIIVVNDKLYFNADPSGEENNYELHVCTDPTNRVYGETILKVFDAPGTPESQAGFPLLFTNLNGSLLMVVTPETESAQLVLYDDGETEKVDDAIDWDEHYVPFATYKNPYIADYIAQDPDIQAMFEEYNPGYWSGVGIEERELPVTDDSPRPNIFPNPASAYIQLSLETATEASLVVYDVQGRVVWYKDNVSNHAQIRVDEIASATGLYYIWVRSDEGLVINPVILQLD